MLNVQVCLTHSTNLRHQRQSSKQLFFLEFFIDFFLYKPGFFFKIKRMNKFKFFKTEILLTKKKLFKIKSIHNPEDKDTLKSCFQFK